MVPLQVAKTSPRLTESGSVTLCVCTKVMLGENLHLAWFRMVMVY